MLKSKRRSSALAASGEVVAMPTTKEQHAAVQISLTNSEVGIIFEKISERTL